MNDLSRCKNSHLRIVLEQNKPLPGPTEERALSFSELHVVLEQRKPCPIPILRTKSYSSPAGMAREELRLQEFHHYERVHQSMSVWAESANDGVCLSAQSRAV
jgi:hypothetical protein